MNVAKILPRIAVAVIDTLGTSVVGITLGKVSIAGTHVARSGKLVRSISKILIDENENMTG